MSSLTAAWAIAATPPPRLTVSDWADLKRMLPERSAVAGAKWRTDRAPYLRGIMDAVHEPGVKTIALAKSAQVGGTEAINNIIGYFIEHDPCPMLLVQPTDRVAEEYSKERLADMIRSTPALSAVVEDARGGDSTLTLKMFPGGYLVLGGANSPNTFARRSVRLAIGDDVDRFPAVVGEEGDPIDLLRKRTTMFGNGIVIMVSTPTLKGGRIDALFQQSDRRRYIVMCPHCGREDWITWSDRAHFCITYQDRDPASARVQCASEEHDGCSAQMDEPTRRAMVIAGEWRPTCEAEEPGLVGFHLPAMITTLGNASLSTWVAEWLSARIRGRESTRVFINTTLGEPWEDRGARMNPHLLMARREDYGDNIEVPMPAVAITAGVDVQENRFEVQVCAWASAMERWLIDWRSVPGNPKQPEAWAALLDALSRRYQHASGASLPIHATCIDSGYETEAVYDFVLAYQVRRIYATKGFAGKSGEPIVGKATEKRYGRSPRPVRLYPINVDDAKGEIMASLALPMDPEAGQHPGAMHFPLHLDTVNEEYFAQLCAEHREPRYNKSNVATHAVWVLDRERNEALDCAVLCLAAFKIQNFNIRQMLEVLGAHVAKPPQAESTRPPVPAPPPAASSHQPFRPGRRFSRSPNIG
jgi:phage terminase large subunit GpA-like protein